MARRMETEPTFENQINYCGRIQRIVVRPTDHTFYAGKSRQSSNYTRNGKGCALIINNMFADMPDRLRRGEEVDLGNLKEMWKKLGSEVLIMEDLSAADMKKELGNFCDKCEGYDYCVIFIMSHGTSDKNGDIILGNDHKEVCVKDDIINKFNNKESPQLQGIPKIFFFQCCRDAVPDKGTPAFSSVPSLRSLNSSSNCANSTGPWGVCSDAGPIASSKVPTTSDMFVSYATQSGNQAFRNTEDGSRYVNAITNVFMNHAKDEHVADLMTKVHNAVSSQTTTSDDQGAMEMPDVKTSLTKKLYLYPGIDI